MILQKRSLGAFFVKVCAHKKVNEGGNVCMQKIAHLSRKKSQNPQKIKKKVTKSTK